VGEAQSRQKGESTRPYLKSKPKKQKRTEGITQVVRTLIYQVLGPEFNPQYCQIKKKKEEKKIEEIVRQTTVYSSVLA
jgi:hypothetical protein